MVAAVSRGASAEEPRGPCFAWVPGVTTTAAHGNCFPAALGCRASTTCARPGSNRPAVHINQVDP